ncbi:restriction endonuclease subunit S [Maricaulis virginensis]|uniref:Type I restriction modification enzyme protein S n=1 Tax=Maricaulis virginensis TaxID=144022 RepID=A0A9W6MMT1_9PROT|nr:restriction endonuclease subunit S [Maricaulis virginensis]GLK51176.1 type I restriction modification enzyme protein S [Maricaulis virginensis]
MSWPMVALGEITAKVEKADPEKRGLDEFDYIDLSAVSQTEKRVNGVARIAASDAPSRARQIVHPGDVLVSTVRPNLNGVAVVPQGLLNPVGSTGFSVLRAKPERLDARYLFHWVRMPTFVDEMVRLSTGQSYPAVSDKIVRSSEIPLPPLDEQKRIAAILDKADALRRARERARELYHSLRRSYFRSVFEAGRSYECVSFGDVVFYQEGPGVRKWQFREAGIKLINVKNLVDGRLVLENTWRHLDEDEVAQKYSHFLLESGDLVIASSGVTWGKIAEVRESHLPLCLNTSVIRLRPNSETLLARYLRAFVEIGSFRQQIERLITGSAQPNFGPSHLAQVQIPLPPREIQQRFSDFSEQLDHLAESNEKAIAEQEALFTSLQSRAFAGEL